MAKGYMIRGVGQGILTDRVYLSPPPLEVLEEALAKELAFHGLDKQGKPRERWVQLHEVEIVGEVNPEAIAAYEGVEPQHTRLTAKLTDEQAEELKKAIKATSGVGKANEDPIVMSGQGTVTNPDDREYEVITEDDIGELKL